MSILGAIPPINLDQCPIILWRPPIPFYSGSIPGLWRPPIPFYSGSIPGRDTALRPTKAPERGIGSDKITR
ncbi:hypothetical protein PRIPAC_75820 [Pristionchus pacificus]|uniref:Uncharacterized protein n=1 Tax=Pristionchus pacificus TaxID=54126 RepID=A0A2A6C0I2_PRIPA|nr:hypothetical protein PRIPAC_75820 [Pristionchus pacificus]|eukprot:PDM71762.1 hypothetical protein PRIPAC_38169 [Pristionchus pacificus]